MEVLISQSHSQSQSLSSLSISLQTKTQTNTHCRLSSLFHWIALTAMEQVVTTRSSCQSRGCWSASTAVVSPSSLVVSCIQKLIRLVVLLLLPPTTPIALPRLLSCAGSQIFVRNDVVRERKSLRDHLFQVWV
jgi:hypothetical protein